VTLVEAALNKRKQLFAAYIHNWSKSSRSHFTCRMTDCEHGGKWNKTFYKTVRNNCRYSTTTDLKCRKKPIKFQLNTFVQLANRKKAKKCHIRTQHTHSRLQCSYSRQCMAWHSQSIRHVPASAWCQLPMTAM